MRAPCPHSDLLTAPPKACARHRKMVPGASEAEVVTLLGDRGLALPGRGT